MACAILLALIPFRELHADKIVLLAANTLGENTRAAELLDDVASGTGIFGPSTFEIITPPEGIGGAAQRLSGRRDLRAVIAIVGDLSLMSGIEPGAPPSPIVSRTSRVMDLAAFEADLIALERAVRSSDAVLLLATAPLGKPGRIEVPELMQVAARCRAWCASGDRRLLDLQAAFRALEAMPLFTNDLDVLDDYGHDALARTLWTAVLRDDALIPARSDAERQARHELTALRALAEGHEAAEALARTVLETPPANAASRTRQAALVTWLDGLAASHSSWAPLTGDMPRSNGPTEEDRLPPPPGLATGLLFSQAVLPEVMPRDPVETGTLEVMRLVADGRTRRAALDDAERSASALVAAHPQRVEAWLVLQVVKAARRPPRDVRHIARFELSRYAHVGVSRPAITELLAEWPRPLTALPGLFGATRPFARQLPTGTVLAKALRRERIGEYRSAVMVLERGLQGLSHPPPSWRAQLQRLRALADG